MTIGVIASYAQDTIYFILTPDGFINGKEPSVSYVVLNYPEKKQDELYNAVLKYATTSFVSPQDVISKIENEVITLNGVTLIINGFSTLFTISFEFKEGRMKVNIPVLIRMSAIGRPGIELTLKGGLVGIFSKNGKLKIPEAKKLLESFFNNMVYEIIDQIEKKGKAEDW